MNWAGSLRLKIVEPARVAIGTGCIFARSNMSSSQLVSSLDKENSDRKTYEVCDFVLFCFR